ncbi:MAG TPA: molybdenum cofactor biosynthesis protein MoaE [Terriglobales bacterium]|nr:molybdenum cofactor biosynthesis protein MoaE [Terriglobales bacterium]
MQVRVLFFGALRDLVGRSNDALTLPEGACLSDLLAHYEAAVPRLKDFLPAIAFSINQEYAPPGAALHDQDEVALLPPVSGGLDESRSHVALVRDRIATETVLARIKQPEDGAVVVFEGIVRDHTRSRRTLYLDYEAYEPMARRKLEELAKEALERFEIREVALVHRLGRLQHSETSVLIAVASAHRAAAFDACRWLIDTLKKTVPIWKKEYFADGAVWADGEPFPDDIPTAGKTLAGPPASK